MSDFERDNGSCRMCGSHGYLHSPWCDEDDRRKAYIWAQSKARELKRREMTVPILPQATTETAEETRDREYEAGYEAGRGGIAKDEKKYTLYSNYRMGYSDGEGDRAYE